MSKKRHPDMTGCPKCGGHIKYSASLPRCESCGYVPQLFEGGEPQPMREQLDREFEELESFNAADEK